MRTALCHDFLENHGAIPKINSSTASTWEQQSRSVAIYTGIVVSITTVVSGTSMVSCLIRSPAIHHHCSQVPLCQEVWSSLVTATDQVDVSEMVSETTTLTPTLTASVFQKYILSVGIIRSQALPNSFGKA